VGERKGREERECDFWGLIVEGDRGHRVRASEVNLSSTHVSYIKKNSEIRVGGKGKGKWQEGGAGRHLARGGPIRLQRTYEADLRDNGVFVKEKRSLGAEGHNTVSTGGSEEERTGRMASGANERLFKG